MRNSVQWIDCSWPYQTRDPLSLVHDSLPAVFFWPSRPDQSQCKKMTLFHKFSPLDHLGCDLRTGFWKVIKTIKSPFYWYKTHDKITDHLVLFSYVASISLSFDNSFDMVLFMRGNTIGIHMFLCKFPNKYFNYFDD